MRITLLAVLLLAGCNVGTAPPAAGPAAAPPPPGAGAPPAENRLTGSRWRLEQFQSSDDAIGVKKPSNPDVYVLELQPEGHLAMQLDCNRATGTWVAQATEPAHGTIALNPLAVTSAACIHETWEGRIPRDLPFVTSYTLAGDTLNLALKMDSGIYTWRRISP